MGIYIYTRRKDVKEVDGIRIVRFAFAYKDGDYYGYPKTLAKISRLEAAGERAADATSDIEYGVRGSDWKHAETEDGMPIFKISPVESSHYNIDINREYVGVLRKEGRKFFIDWGKQVG